MKKFWIIVGVIVVLLLIRSFYNMGKLSATPMTKEQESNEIKKCNRWGGDVIYDSSGGYYGCAGVGNN